MGTVLQIVDMPNPMPNLVLHAMVTKKPPLRLRRAAFYAKHCSLNSIRSAPFCAKYHTDCARPFTPGALCRSLSILHDSKRDADG